jgi:hypothetical protein
VRRSTQRFSSLRFGVIRSSNTYDRPGHTFRRGASLARASAAQRDRERRRIIRGIGREKERLLAVFLPCRLASFTGLYLRGKHNVWIG